MESNEALAQQPERVFRDGRRHFSAQVKREVIEQCLAPGASVAAVSLRHGFNANLVRKWIRTHQHRLARERAASHRMVPVSVRESAPAAASRVARGGRRSRRDIGASDMTSVQSAPIEVHVGAARIVVPASVDRQLLRRLIEALSAGAR